jgi:hypothetical protein
MDRVSIQNIMPVFGIVLGALLLFNTVVPLAADGCDLEGGWITIYQGDPCSQTTVLHCSGGQSLGVQSCGHSNPTGNFIGVELFFPWQGRTVNLLGNAGCITSQHPGSNLCPTVRDADCI